MSPPPTKQTRIECGGNWEEWAVPPGENTNGNEGRMSAWPTGHQVGKGNNGEGMGRERERKRDEELTATELGKQQQNGK